MKCSLCKKVGTHKASGVRYSSVPVCQKHALYLARVSLDITCKAEKLPKP